jgi:hypothetical protein
MSWIDFGRDLSSPRRGNPGGIMVRPGGATSFSASDSEQNENANKIGRLTTSGDFNRIDRLAA